MITKATWQKQYQAMQPDRPGVRFCYYDKEGNWLEFTYENYKKVVGGQ